MKKVLVTVAFTEAQKEMILKEAGDGCEIYFRKASEISDEELGTFSAVIGNLPPIRMKAAEKLEWFQLNSAGANQYTVPGILREDVVLTNASGAYGLAVSEHMVAMSFSLVRHFEQYHGQQLKHEWKDCGNIISIEGATILVLGVGDIGGAYARKMKALGAYVIGVRRTDRDKPEYLDEQYRMEELDQVIGRADIVAMVLPGGDATRAVINAERLQKMKKGAYLINVGRGNAADADALKAALRSGHLGGAALDVTDPEPLPAEDELWDMNNVLITPHVAGDYYLPETLQRIAAISAANLRAWLHDGEFIKVVNRETGY